MLEFEIEGEKQLSRRFRGISLAGKDWKRTFQKVGNDLTGLFSGSVFETRGAEIGERWKARKGGGSWPLLERSGKMRRGFMFEAKSDSLQVYNITDYFKFHQSNKPRKKLPRRVMMKIDDKRRNMVVQTFHKDIQEKLRTGSI